MKRTFPKCLTTVFFFFVVSGSLSALGDEYYIEYYERTPELSDRLDLLTDFAQRGAGVEFWDHVLEDLYGRRLVQNSGSDNLSVQRGLGIVLAQYSPQKPSDHMATVFNIARNARNADLKTMAIYALRCREDEAAHTWVAEQLLKLAAAPGPDPQGEAQVAGACIATLYYSSVPSAETALMLAACSGNWFPDSVRNRASAVLAMRREGS